MKLCVNCKYYVEPRRCRHDVSTDPVDGTSRGTSCDDMRGPMGSCGVEGRLWWGHSIPEPVLQPEARHDSRI